MGICATSEAVSEEQKRIMKEEQRRAKQVNLTLKKAREENAMLHKLLLLGAGGSGKSTIFKQMKTIYDKGFPEEERLTYAPIIAHNAVRSTQVLLKEALKGEEKLQEASLESMKFLQAAKGKLDHIDEKLGHHIAVLWSDPAIKHVWENRSSFQVYDSTSYFLDKIDLLSSPDYIPSEKDVLHCRIRTTGISENRFKVEGNDFLMVDVGGQRNERKKWIHCFDNVTAILFVAAVSAYDQVLYEDNSMNRMHEALKLFNEQSNSNWFKAKPIILFLNKRDIFMEKINRVPLTVCFENYDGPSEYQTATAFIRAQFLKQNENPQREVYCHLTCATDTRNITTVFRLVKDIVLRVSLAEADLI